MLSELKEFIFKGVFNHFYRQKHSDPYILHSSTHTTFIALTLQVVPMPLMLKNSNFAKKAIRIVAKANYTAHTAPIFTELNILPVDKLITQAKLTFMHSVCP